MEHEGYSNVRIENPISTQKLACLLFSFISLFILLIVVGATGPKMWVLQETQGTDPSVNFYLDPGYRITAILGSEREIKPENQIFSIETRLSAPTFTNLDTWSKVSASIEFYISLYSGEDTLLKDESVVRDVDFTSDKSFSDWTDLLTLDFVHAETYTIVGDIVGPSSWAVTLTNGTELSIMKGAYMQTETRVWYVNADYTKFEMVWRYVFFSITFLILFTPKFGYISALHRLPEHMWSFQQKWTLLLLAVLLAFDDCLYPLRIYPSGNVQLAFTCIHIISVLCFMFYLLLWWLCALSEVKTVSRYPNSSEINSSIRPRSFWCWKIMLVLSIVLVNLAAYFYYRYNKYVTPTYNGVADDNTKAKVFAGFLSALLCIYLLWCIKLAAINCRNVLGASPGYLFLYSITSVTMIISVIGVFIAGFYPWSTSTLTFLGFHGLYNIYIWILAYAYAPMRGLSRRGEQAETEMTGKRDGYHINEQNI